jgi:hypothetical protein
MNEEMTNGDMTANTTGWAAPMEAAPQVTGWDEARERDVQATPRYWGGLTNQRVEEPREVNERLTRARAGLTARAVNVDELVAARAPAPPIMQANWYDASIISLFGLILYRKGVISDGEYQLLSNIEGMEYGAVMSKVTEMFSFVE